MVTTVIGHHHILQAATLCNTSCYGQHDAVAERNHRGFHVVFCIMAFGNGVGAFQERTLEILRHECQRNRDVLNAQLLAMILRKWNLTAVMITAVIERNSQCNPFTIIIEKRSGIHSATQDKNTVFHLFLSYTFYLHKCSLGNRLHGKGTAGGIRFFKELCIHFVHRGKISDIGQ